MNSSPGLGARLKAIFNLVAAEQQKNPYTKIWDCCCDHGYLGLKLLSENLCKKIVFVDQIPHIIEQLETRLDGFNREQYELIAGDAGDLRFNRQERHLVIIAGVGGECTVDIISAIEGNNPDVKIDYIFCPSTSQKELRKYLISQNFGMAFENIVCENKRYYEMLYVKRRATGDDLPYVSETCTAWDESDADHQRYLSKLALHEHKKCSGGKL